MLSIDTGHATKYLRIRLALAYLKQQNLERNMVTRGALAPINELPHVTELEKGELPDRSRDDPF